MLGKEDSLQVPSAPPVPVVTPDASQLEPLGGTLSLSIPTQTEPKIHSKPTW